MRSAAVLAVALFLLPTALAQFDASAVSSADLNDLEESASWFGVKDEAADHNIVVDGHGTGFAPPSEEAYERLFSSSTALMALPAAAPASCPCTTAGPTTCPMIHGSRRWETRRLREAARPGPWRTIATGIRRRRTTTGSMPGPTRSIRYPPHGATTACPEGMMEVPGWATWPMCCATGGRRPWRPCRMIRLTVGPGARKMRSERRLSIERMKHVISRMREIARSSD